MTTTDKTHQTEPIRGDQVRNQSGGAVWEADLWSRVDRFLILGVDGGTIYATERQLAKESAQVVQTCLKADGLRTIERIAEVSEQRLAVRNDPAIFALAMALKFSEGPEAESVKVRRAAADAVPRVCRIGTHLFNFAEFVNQLGGWGRVTKRAFQNFYNSKSDEDAAYQLIKYQQRNGWSHRDVLLKAHVSPENETRDALYEWAAQGWDTIDDDAPSDKVLARVWAFERAKRAGSTEELINLIADYNLPRECIPTEYLNDLEIWEALLEKMPVWATVRNLSKMTSIGLLTNVSDATSVVVERLKAHAPKMHPLNLLNAQRVYASGRGRRGSLTWNAVPKISDALNTAFYESFDHVEPTGKRICLALDISGSMTWSSCAGLEGLTPMEASAAIAMTIARTEKNHEIVGFSHKIKPLDISPSRRLDDVIKYMKGLEFGSTDCALPMIWARQNNRDFDAFVTLTDSETYWGNTHPKEALDTYRSTRNIPARSAVVAMQNNKYTIADPEDAGMIDVVGCDSSLPTILRDFIQGKI